MYHYLVLLSEGGIVQYEHVYTDETEALALRHEWLDGDNADTDNDAYIYRIRTTKDPGRIKIERGQGVSTDTNYDAIN